MPLNAAGLAITVYNYVQDSVGRPFEKADVKHHGFGNVAFRSTAMRTTAWDTFLRLFMTHPLLAVSLGVLFALILLLGSAHTLRLLFNIALVILREFKHEILGILIVFQEIRREIRQSENRE